MNSRVLREIPLKILHRKVGDERVTLLQACYDNPIFNEDDTKGFPTQNGSNRTGKPGEYGTDVFEDGVETHSSVFPSNKHSASCHVANDYMHSLPPSRSMPNDITFRAHRKRSRLLLLLLLMFILMVAVIIGLLIHYVGGDSKDSSSLTPYSPSPSPVITLANIQGSLTIIGGPFAAYNPVVADSRSPAYSFIRKAFVFKMDAIFMSSNFANMYNKTQMLYIRENGSHVLLSFLIHVRPQLSIRSKVDLISQIEGLLVKGFENSLFIIDKDSITLVAHVITPVVTTTPAPGICQPIALSMCVNMTKYSTTAYPNVIGHRSPQEAEVAIRQNYSYIFDYPCYRQRIDYYCSIFAPECDANGQGIPPCRQYCLDLSDGLCEGMYPSPPVTPMPFSCDDLPDSDDPNVCRQNPYSPGVCVDVDIGICQDLGFNRTVLPNILGDVALDQQVAEALHLLLYGINMATDCSKHTGLFACSLFTPPCSGKPMPNHYIPPCASLCQSYIDRCGIFLDMFAVPWPESLNCSNLPDSPDPNVCVGFHEGHEVDIAECAEGEVKCKNNRCIKTSWYCDGFQDCDDNSDEAHCARCSPDQLTCSPASSLCIDKAQGCDGANDCYMDVDEHFCVRMDTNTDEDVLQVYNSLSSEWEEVCKDDWTTEFSEIACKQLGYKTALATYYETGTSAKKSKLTTLKNGSDPDRLQSYLDKGYSSCSSGFVVKLVCWETVCGIRPAYFTSATRVVGGDEVKPGTWPWMASLHGGSGHKFFCGATVIDSQWILTAAHCVLGGIHETSYWYIKTGNTRRVAYSEHRQVRQPRSFFKHPDFDQKTVENDIALIQLDRPLAMNDFVRPICIADHIPADGTRCFATGWGKSSGKATRYEPAMRQVALDVTPWGYCKRALMASDDQIPYRLTKTMFCAGGTHFHDACQGDSGGPLVCKKDNTTDEWYQTGIVSWGVACAHPNTPGVYTNIPLYADWIREVIANYTYSIED